MTALGYHLAKRKAISNWASMPMCITALLLPNPPRTRPATGKIPWARIGKTEQVTVGFQLPFSTPIAGLFLPGVLRMIQG